MVTSQSTGEGHGDSCARGTTNALRLQEHAVVVPPEPIALNGCLPTAPTTTAPGDIVPDTLTDVVSLTTAVANLVPSATEVAVISMVKGAVTEAGAV